ncbi:unnamed protein product [Caenorhabditis sp. 36 PRJEB53466]|nr:unnamed protein product [Caenorhabditis sp. 36 PRJEB53466]
MALLPVLSLSEMLALMDGAAKIAVITGALPATLEKFTKGFSVIKDYISGKIASEKQKREVTQKLEEIAASIEKLDEKLSGQMKEIEQNITVANFFNGEAKQAQVTWQFIKDFFDVPTKTVIDNTKKRLEAKARMEYARGFIASLKRPETNPLLVILKTENPRTQATFDKWNDIFDGILFQFMLIELFIDGILDDTEHSIPLLLLKNVKSFQDQMKTWKSQYQEENWTTKLLPLVTEKQDRTKNLSKQQIGDQVLSTLKTWVSNDVHYWVIVFNETNERTAEPYAFGYSTQFLSTDKMPSKEYKTLQTVFSFAPGKFSVIVHRSKLWKDQKETTTKAITEQYDKFPVAKYRNDIFRSNNFKQWPQMFLEYPFGGIQIAFLALINVDRDVVLRGSSHLTSDKPGPGYYRNSISQLSKPTNMSANDSDDEQLKTALAGRWKILGSTGVEQFMEKRAAGDLADATFQYADNVIEFNADTVTMYDPVGNRKLNRISAELFQLTPIGSRSILIHISENSLKSTFYGEDSSEEQTEERYVKDGKLHVIVTRNEVSCTRIYGKGAESGGCSEELEKLRAENEKLKAELEVLKAKDAQKREELENLFAENAKLKTDLEASKAKEAQLTKELEEFSAQNAKLQADLAAANAKIAELEEKLRNCGGSAKELEDLRAENARLKAEVAALTSQIASLSAQIQALQAKDTASANEIAQLRAQNANLLAQWQAQQARIVQLEQQLRNGQTQGGGDILQRVVGTWRYRADFQDITNIRIDNNRMVLTNTPSNIVLDYPIGAMNGRGYVTSVENNKIVMRNQQLGQREEWSLENGQIVLTCYSIYNNSKAAPVPAVEESVPSDPTPPSLPPIPTITPSLCIDNQYFANYINEKPKVDDVDYLSRAFQSFAKIQGAFHEQRTNYFERRGLLEAIEINIEQQNSRISEALGCLAVCNEITEKYQCTLESSFQVLVDDFSEKAFKLSSLTSQLHALRQTHNANLKVRKTEETKLEEISWRIEREQKRIAKLDEKLWKFYENRDKGKP